MVRNLVGHSQAGAAKRTAQIIDPATWLTVSCCQNTDHGQYGRVAGNRPVDHISKHCRDFFVEHKITAALLVGKNIVTHRWWLLITHLQALQCGPQRAAPREFFVRLPAVDRQHAPVPVQNSGH